jgi:acylphosphatase
VTEARGAAYDAQMTGASSDPNNGSLLPIRATVFVRGAVQGVGFRWWTRARARELGVSGWARNTFDGRVEVVAEGSPVAVTRLLELLVETPSTRRRPGRVVSVSEPLWSQARGETGFDER